MLLTWISIKCSHQELRLEFCQVELPTHLWYLEAKFQISL